MKGLFLILLVGLAIQVFSQGRDEQYTPPPMQQNRTQNVNGTTIDLNMIKSNHYKKMRTLGVVLTSVGSIFVVSGIALLKNEPRYGVMQGAIGALLTAGGTVFLGIGVPNLIIGSIKYKRYRYQVSILFAPTGCRIAYTF